MIRLRSLTILFFLSGLLVISCSENTKSGMMPVTTESALALELYETGLLAHDFLKTELARHNLKLAIEEDPDFFMAHFWIYWMTSKDRKELVEQALQTKGPLTEAEAEIKTALRYIRDGQSEKAVQHLRNAVELYPADPYVQRILYSYQFFYIEDLNAAVSSMREAIQHNPDYPLVYNLLGYALMDMDNFKEAEKAFDKYIELAPEQGNPYDSKGDFFMGTGQYEKAYQSYMKAVELDPHFTVSRKKAEKALKMMEEPTE